MGPGSYWLIIAGILDLAAAVAHLGCIAGGARWYRSMGAGENIAHMVERGELAPTLVTLIVAGVLFGWAAYAFSAAGLLPRLPLLSVALVAITTVCLLRAAALPVMLRRMPDRSVTFLVVSSVIVLALGVIHGIGMWLRCRAVDA